MDRRNEECAKGSPAVAGCTGLRFAMRELLGGLHFWLGLGAVVLVLVVTGPYGTSEIMTVGERAIYWAVIGLATGPAGVVACLLVAHAAARAEVPGWGPAVLGGLAAGPVVTLIVWAVNVAWLDGVLGTRATPLAEIGPFLATNCAVAVAIAVLWQTVEGARSAVDAPWPVRHTEDAPDLAMPEALMAKLPLEVRGPVRRISMQDHYAQIVTARGTALVLLRMTDAAAMLGEAGLRVHRSHWVRPAHVAGAARSGSDWVLTMDDGARVPVGRSYVPRARAAGLLGNVGRY